MRYSEHNFKEEAKIVRRLLKDGVNINQFHKKYGSPLVCLYNSGTLVASDKHGVAKAKPLWDELLKWPDLDFDVLINRKGRPKVTLRERVFDLDYVGWNLTEFRKWLYSYDEKQLRKGSI